MSPVRNLKQHTKVKLKYGENPHQSATATDRASRDPLAISKFKRLDGRPFVGNETSWISITDLGRLIQVVERFAAAYRKNVAGALPYVAVIVKHGSPCGAAFGSDPEAVARDVWLGDPQAAFGGSLLATFPITKEIISALSRANSGKIPFINAVAAPSFEAGVVEIIGAKSKPTHFIVNRSLSKLPVRPHKFKETKSVRDIILEQAAPQFIPDFSGMTHGGAEISANEKNRIFADLSLAYAVCSASTSNTVTLVRGGVLIGNATGQQKRVGSAKLAVRLAEENGHDAKGAVAVSDSYFPFPDGIDALAQGGVKAIFATSGSVRDKEVFARAASLGVSFFSVPDKVGRMFAGH